VYVIGLLGVFDFQARDELRCFCFGQSGAARRFCGGKCAESSGFGSLFVLFS